jgi:copper chaperone CopZ
MRTEQYSVTGLTCGGCVAMVKSILSDHAENVIVTLDPPLATLANPSSSFAEMNQALGEKYTLMAREVIKEAAPPVSDNVNAPESSWLATYYPLLLIIGFITLVSVLAQLTPSNIDQPFDVNQWMMHFMAGFFLVFSFFKLLDIQSFASSYAMYDLLAMRVNAYGLLYPFIELGLGIAYLLAWQPTFINAFTFVVMAFSSIGVIRSVINQQKIRCACLGSVFNLPMSTVTIIEDLAMAGMALFMLIK